MRDVDLRVAARRFEVPVARVLSETRT